MHGQFAKIVAEQGSKETWAWLRQGTLKKETEGTIFFLYPLKDYIMNLQPTLLYKITIPYSYTILLETIPRGAKDYDYPKAN